jgi:hypothetical protein
LSLCFVVQTYLMPSALCTPSHSMSATESKWFPYNDVIDQFVIVW